MDGSLSIPVIIIDDEELIRSLIKCSVDWVSLGFSIVAEADNSDDAIHLVQQKNPLVAVIDINIPYINGIELAKLLRAQYPDLAIIILTGYEEFSSAQEAIRIGVDNYLLKPLKADELLQSLTMVRSRIVEREQGDFVNRLSHQLDLEGDLKTKQEFLRILISRSSVIPLDILQRGAILFNLDLADPGISFHQVMVVACRTITNKVQVLAETRLESLERTYPVSLHWTFDYHGSPALVLFWRESKRQVCQRDGEQIAIALRHQVAIDGKLQCSIGLGSLESEPNKIADSYRRAVTALEKRFYTEQDRVFSARESFPVSQQPELGLSALFEPKRLLVMLRGGAEHELLDTIRKGIRMMQTQLLHREQCGLLVMRYVNALEIFMQEQHIGMNKVFGESFDLFGELQSLGSLVALRDWLEWTTAQIFLTVVDNGKSRTHFIVMRARRFIEQHHGRSDLNLDMIAEHVQVSPSYLSSSFKKILGISIVSYITEFRVGKAKQIMESDPLLTVSEVAEAVGYSDAFYFSKVFSRQEGVTPSQFIKRSGGDS